ncbi:MAG: potassium channel protein [Thermodesulfobacteriota bacterium]|nr:potassium channel protein [Thermodesulfobacteriota bacterium]
MSRAIKLIIAVCLSMLLLTIGTVGYMLIEGWSFMDGLYMTVITLATVGYGEVHSMSQAGRLFTVIFIVLGVGFTLYVIGNVVQFLVEGQIRTILGRFKLEKQISRLKDHYIVCGYGRIGRALSGFLIQKYLDIVVIEKDHGRIPVMNEDGVLYLVGEAADPDNLVKAGLKRAKGLLAVLASDADNVFLVLTAKRLNPDIFIVARAVQNSTKETLYSAGANNVVSPYDLGARRMAHAILRPSVIQFLEMAFVDSGTDIYVEEFPVGPASRLVGCKLIDSGIRKDLDLIIITIKKADGDMSFNPSADTVIEAGDTLIAVGASRNLLKLSKRLNP